jgi:formylglycine-generating enzyme required for sulfatase activity
MKTPLLLVPLLAALTAGLWFYSPTPKSGTQVRGQGAGTNAAGAEPRVALVIGNSAYREGPLANPVNDSRDMAAALRQFGFEVLSGEDLNHRQMEDLIREFGQKIRNRGIGMFYFAGHGFQVNGLNYLIPIGAVINGEAEVKYEAVDAGLVLAQMEQARNRLNIVVLDACRNNPFARSFRSSSRGLASIEAPVGTYIAYATSPGSTASDGGGRNGLYTKELLAAMRVPDLKLEDVFKRVRTEVRRQSNNQQIPWEASSIEGDFYFSSPGVRPGPGSNSTNASLTPVIALPSGVPPGALRSASFTTASVDSDGRVTRREAGPAQFYEVDLGGGVKMEMVAVRGGRFQMGSPANEQRRFDDETQHWVRVSDFWIGRYEVTQAQWKAVMGSLPPERSRPLSKFIGDDLPVVSMGWDGAKQFCERLDAKLGLPPGSHRLPYEAEWEYAARGGKQTSFAFGPTITPEVVNYNQYDSPDPESSRLVAVGSLGIANPYGLFDMHGNAWEICEDWYGNYPGEEVSDPTGPSTGSDRVRRGGAHLASAGNCRSAARARSDPGAPYNYQGFRLVRKSR